MSRRRREERQLPLPHVPAADTVEVPSPPPPAVAPDPWAAVRCDRLVEVLLADVDRSARGLALELRSSPTTVARIRRGGTPRPALRARLVQLAWRALDEDACAAAALGPEPEDNLRWHARRRFSDAHAYPKAPAAPETRSLCLNEFVRRVCDDWPTEPDGFAALCPTCLHRAREGQERGR